MEARLRLAWPLLKHRAPIAVSLSRARILLSTLAHVQEASSPPCSPRDALGRPLYIVSCQDIVEAMKLSLQLPSTSSSTRLKDDNPSNKHQVSVMRSRQEP